MFLSNYKTLHRYDNLHFDTPQLSSALFHPLDIEKFESDHPELFPKTPLAQSREQIAELKRQLEEVRQENEKLKSGRDKVVPPAPVCENCPSGQDAEQQRSDLEATNQDLQSRLDAALGGRDRWQPSCNALFQAFKQVTESARDDWVKDEFLALAGRLYGNGDKRGVLAEAGNLAWAALPDRFKAGPGNPKYKGNPTKE
jgi:hypothetical protein